MGKSLGLRPQAPVGEALKDFARDILREARAALDGENSDAAAVHDFRKAMKRWRALLRLAEPLVGVDARRLREEARDLARELAAARDRQSALDALADIEKAGDGLSARTLASIRRRLETVRQQAESVALNEAMRERLRAAMEAGGRAIEHWPLDETDFAAVARGLADAYVRVRDAVPPNWTAAGDEALHRLRQRVVVHRYQMQLIEPLWPRLGRLWTAEAQRLRERLGAHQDLAVLSAFTAPHQPLAPWRARLAPPIAARKAAHVAAAARLAERLLAERPRAFRRRLEALWNAGAHPPDAGDH